MKKILVSAATGILVAIITLCLYSFKSNAEGGKFLFLRLIETGNGMANSGMIVTDGEKIIKSVELPTLKGKNFTENTKMIAKEISDIIAQGYKLSDSNSGGADPFIVTNYIFEKQ